MQESYSENLASYAGPESYADGGDTVGVATAGVHAGQLLVSFPQLCMKHDDLHVIVAVSGGSFWRTADACNKLFSRHQAFDTSSTPL
jgi:hypothetical protein